MTRLSHNQTGSTPARRGPGSLAPRRPTVAQLIEFGAREFESAGLAYGHGTDNAIDDAAALVFHVLDLRHENAAHEYAQRPHADAVQRVLDVFAARIEQRIPVAYLMGRMWFAGFGFTVDPGHTPNGTRIAFWAETPEEVDRLAEVVRAAGAKNLDGPELVPGYRPGYYALFFDDPEGNQLEICCRAEPIVKE